MTVNETLQKFDLASWTHLARIGTTNAISGLSKMVNQEITISALNMEEVSLRNASDLIGKPDELIVGIYLLFEGGISGQIMLAFTPPIAYELVDMAMEIPVGTTKELGEMEYSVLGEIGNIVGTFFLNAVADNVGMRLSPSPPAVVVDMVGAVMGSVMAHVLQESESVFVIRLSFNTSERNIEGRFLVLPSFKASEKTPAAVEEN